MRDSMADAVGDRIGMRESVPGVFVGLRSQVSQGARLEPPCWIGNYTWIGSDAKIGPNTYVGALTEVRESFARGHGLLKWRTVVLSEVTDDFLLCDLASQTKSQRRRATLAGKATALLALLLTWPVPLIGWLHNHRSGKPLLMPHLAVRAPLIGTGKLMETHRSQRRWMICWTASARWIQSRRS